MAMSERAGMENIVMKRLLLVGAAFAAQIASATAADMAPLDRGPLAAIFNWTGAYVGADIGGAWSNIQSNFGGGNASSVIGGAYAGYNWQLAPPVADRHRGRRDLGRPHGAGRIRRRELAREPARTNRLEPDRDHDALLHRWRSMEHRQHSTGVDTLPATQTKTGWVVGGGLEWAPWANTWLVRAEYLNYSFTGIPLGAGSGSDLTISEARIGVAYKF